MHYSFFSSNLSNSFLKKKKKKRKKNDKESSFTISMFVSKELHQVVRYKFSLWNIFKSSYCQRKARNRDNLKIKIDCSVVIFFQNNFILYLLLIFFLLAKSLKEQKNKYFEGIKFLMKLKKKYNKCKDSLSELNIFKNFQFHSRFS